MILKLKYLEKRKVVFAKTFEICGKFLNIYKTEYDKLTKTRKENKYKS